MTATLIVAHPVTGEALPPFLTARQCATLLGRSEQWVALACARGELPSLPHVDSAPWSIPTLELLRAAGFSVLASHPPLPPFGEVTDSSGRLSAQGAERDDRGPDADSAPVVAATRRRGVA